MAADSPAAKAFRENVKHLMESRDTTITEIASTLGMSRPSLSRVIAGTEGITIARAERIASFFGLELSYLLKPRRNFSRAS